VSNIPPLPHSGHALLLTAVIRHDGQSIEATGVVPSTHPLVSGGRAPGILGLELGAQAAAAMEALAPARPFAGARAGYVVRVREAAFAEPDLPVDTPIRVYAQLEGAAPPLTVYRISVSIGEAEALSAVLSTLSVGAGQKA
jgi:predicted hotdog family 3-hydroxylacyl-ACP dehydratase